MSLIASFAWKWFVRQQFWDFPSFRWLWQGDVFFTTGSGTAFSVLFFFFFSPSQFFSLRGKSVGSQADDYKKKPLLHQNVWWWDRKDQMTQFFLLMWSWHQIWALQMFPERWPQCYHGKIFLHSTETLKICCGECTSEDQRWLWHTPAHLSSAGIWHHVI